MSDYAKELVTKLKEVRQKKNISQRELERISGVAQEMISRIENGAVIPTIETVGKLAKALGLKIDLVDDEQE